MDCIKHLLWAATLKSGRKFYGLKRHRKFGNLARCVVVVPEFLINFKFLLAITISSSESLLQKINTLVLMSPTWLGGWGWAWTGWPAGTGSGSPCPGAAPASWRWRPGPAEEGECHQNMGGSNTIPGQNVAPAPVSEHRKHKYRRWRTWRVLRERKLC